MCRLSNYFKRHKYQRDTAKKWQARAEEVYLESFVGHKNACKKVTAQILKEMEEDGLVFGKDFVTVIGNIVGYKVPDEAHICIEMFGKNSKRDKFNGWRVDGTAKGAEMTISFKGEYLD